MTPNSDNKMNWRITYVYNGIPHIEEYEFLTVAEIRVLSLAFMEIPALLERIYANA